MIGGGSSSERRVVNVLVDNPSWVLPWAQSVADGAIARGFEAQLVRDHDSIQPGGVTFFLGCIRIAPVSVLARSIRNLVVHASELPKGRGFSPLSWLVLSGANDIPVCLLEAGTSVDSGPVVFRDVIRFGGHELIGEMRESLGAMSRDLCLRFIDRDPYPTGCDQIGEPSVFRRRRATDSRIDPTKSIAEQFDLLRIVDNDAYPAFFDFRGHRYRLKIEKAADGE